VPAGTLQAAAVRGRRFAHCSCTVTPGFDIDRAEDLHWLAEARHENATLPCPRTLAFVDEWRR
jgi:predicted cupin superfamily sugar epimerase